MRTLIPLNQIPVPDPKPDQIYSGNFFGREISFHGLKKLLGAADFDKAGDRNANLAAPDEITREAARTLLSDLTLQHIYDRPLTNSHGVVDSVMRVNYDIDLQSFATIASMTIGEFKNHLLRTPGRQLQGLTRSITGTMAAAVAKLCDVHELISIARKLRHTTKARTQLGLPGTLSSRCQPNHPTDDLRGITLLIYWGFSLGSGDALIGVNPAVDTVENVSAILHQLDRARKSAAAPTQICVLAHIKTQMACLARGAPVEIMFQSLAGTEATILSEFDISVDLLDQGYQAMAGRGPLNNEAKQFMYFETGQGSEFTYGKHDGIDMTTTEALTYGLARRYDPFMVNNVTGFIGPETHRDSQEMVLANLQDQFMGKLLGLPMGMAPCYTLHSQIILEGQQMATQLLTAAGAVYYMDVELNTDRMLAYFDTSGHDNQTLREIHGKRPAPEFLNWAIERGIFLREPDGSIERGPHWGNPRQFCSSDEEFAELTAATPAPYGYECAGSRPANEVSRRTKLQQAVGREAIRAELDLELLQRLAPFRMIATEASSKEDHLNSPQRGSMLSAESASKLKPEHTQVQILVSEGLSAEAIHHNVNDLLPVLLDGLNCHQLSQGQPLATRYGRVKLAEQLADILQTELVIHLIGERPGGDALASQSLSAYLVYRLGTPDLQKRAAAYSGNEAIGFEYTVISNIYSAGLPPVEAASLIVEKAITILQHQAAGNRLEARLHLSTEPPNMNASHVAASS
jgi:ethanolamine ammonia-lyase large subunit